MDERVDGQRETRDHTLGDTEDATRQLVESVKTRLQSLSHISPEICIYRVPKHLRDINEDAYFPRVVSIGPFHHGNQSLKAMEDHKWRFFRSFIENTGLDLDALVRFVKRHESKVREFYAEPIPLHSDQLVQVILVDAIFVITVFLGYLGSIHDKSLRRQVVRDLLLLENQLPFFILKETLDFARTATGISHAPILELTYDFSPIYVKQEGVRPAANLNPAKIRHLIDFLRLHLLDRQKPEDEGNFVPPNSLTELHEAGVKFKSASSKQLLDIKFEDGSLTIPFMDVNDDTESFFRNLLAYDMCCHGPSYVSDYFAVMAMLIRTSNDVELIVKNGILKNSLANNQEVAKLFNGLGKELDIDPSSFYYSHLCNELNEYCKIPWHKWKAILKRNYLDTPWAIVSVFAASVLLILALIQTVCAVIKP